jgi:hypothetical protein
VHVFDEIPMTALRAPPAATEVVLPWFRSEDWDQWRTLLVDGHRLPQDYRSWFFRAEMVRRRLERDGVRVELIVLEPDIFRRWCRAHDLTPDADASSRFAAEIKAHRTV